MGVPPWTIAEATSLSLQREPEGLDQHLKPLYHLKIPNNPRRTSRTASFATV